MISSSSAWKVRLMAANTSSLEVCFAGPKIACSLRPAKIHSHEHLQACCPMCTLRSPHFAELTACGRQLSYCKTASTAICSCIAACHRTC